LILDFLFSFNKAPETNNEDEINLPDIDNNLINNLNNEINGEITSDEIVSCGKNLKNDQASGGDFILNLLLTLLFDLRFFIFLDISFLCIFMLASIFFVFFFSSLHIFLGFYRRVYFATSFQFSILLTFK
jgi:hypothetical protein